MAKVAKLFKDPFDSFEQDDDGCVSLICNECAEKFKIPSPMDMVERDDPDMDHANEISKLIERVLEHLDQCQPSA